jgi:hypothetical protein
MSDSLHDCLPQFVPMQYEPFRVAVQAAKLRAKQATQQTPPVAGTPGHHGQHGELLATLSPAAMVSGNHTLHIGSLSQGSDASPAGGSPTKPANAPKPLPFLSPTAMQTRAVVPRAAAQPEAGMTPALAANAAAGTPLRELVSPPNLGQAAAQDARREPAEVPPSGTAQTPAEHVARHQPNAQPLTPFAAASHVDKAWSPAKSSQQPGCANATPATVHQAEDRTSHQHDAEEGITMRTPSPAARAASRDRPSDMQLLASQALLAASGDVRASSPPRDGISTPKSASRKAESDQGVDAELLLLSQQAYTHGGQGPGIMGDWELDAVRGALEGTTASQHRSAEAQAAAAAAAAAAAIEAQYEREANEVLDAERLMQSEALAGDGSDADSGPDGADVEPPAAQQGAGDGDPEEEALRPRGAVSPGSSAPASPAAGQPRTTSAEGDADGGVTVATGAGAQELSAEPRPLMRGWPPPLQRPAEANAAAALRGGPGAQTAPAALSMLTPTKSEDGSLPAACPETQQSPPDMPRAAGNAAVPASGAAAGRSTERPEQVTPVDVAMPRRSAWPPPLGRAQLQPADTVTCAPARSAWPPRLPAVATEDAALPSSSQIHADVAGTGHVDRPSVQQDQRSLQPKSAWPPRVPVPQADEQPEHAQPSTGPGSPGATPSRLRSALTALSPAKSSSAAGFGSPAHQSPRATQPTPLSQGMRVAAASHLQRRQPGAQAMSASTPVLGPHSVQPAVMHACDTDAAASVQQAADASAAISTGAKVDLHAQPSGSQAAAVEAARHSGSIAQAAARDGDVPVSPAGAQALVASAFPVPAPSQEQPDLAPHSDTSHRPASPMRAATPPNLDAARSSPAVRTGEPQRMPSSGQHAVRAAAPEQQRCAGAPLPQPSAVSFQLPPANGNNARPRAWPQSQRAARQRPAKQGPLAQASALHEAQLRKQLGQGVWLRPKRDVPALGTLEALRKRSDVRDSFAAFLCQQRSCGCWLTACMRC